MRRMMMVGSLPPFTVGAPTDGWSLTGNTGVSGLLYIISTGAAPKAGTLTTAKIAINATGTLYLTVGAWDGSQYYTPRSVSGALSAGSTGTITLSGFSIACQTGDLLGVYIPSSGGSDLQYSVHSGAVVRYFSPGSVPTPGNALAATGTLSGYDLATNATGA